MEIQEINEIIRSQEADYNEIRQIFTNIKKDSATRKTLKYIAERRARLTEIFNRTSVNHARLEKQEVMTDHKYITTNYFNSIKTQYTQSIEYLLKCEKRLQLVHQLYEPEDIDTQEEEVISSSKIFIQLFRISQIQKKLQSTTQLLTEDKPTWYLESLLANLQKQWQDIEETNLFILMEDSTLEHSYFREHLFERTQTEFELIVEQLVAKLGEKTKNTNHKTSVMLPKIVIPIFTGSYESWNSFYDLFLKIIHEEKSLTATEKMQYLKTHIRGDAAKLIKHLTVCDANYLTAWSLLIKRYKNERIIITKHVDNILSLQTIRKGNATNLRNLHDTINENLEALKSQNIDISNWDPILTRLLSRIWDSETEEKYEHQLEEPNKVQEFSKMMQFLEKRFKCLETTSASKEGTLMYKSRHESTSVINKQSDTRNCWFCNNNEHNIYQCASFKTLSAYDRNKAVIEKEMCKNCLMHDKSIKCHSTKNCGYCGKKGHHSYLHQNIQNIPQSKNTYTKNEKSNALENNNTSTSKPATKTMSNMSSTNKIDMTKTTLLATALVKTYSMDGTPLLLRVLCDQGSEASFCTEEVAQLLAYPRIKIQTEIIGIADEKPKTSNYSIDVQLRPRFSSDYDLLVTLIILPKLTGSLPKKNLPQLQTDSLQNKLIADPTYYKRGPIDIILGAQEYSKLLRSGVQKIQDGIIAQDTEFGWILSGFCRNDYTSTMKIISMMTRTIEIDQLNKFWELEEVPEKYQLSNEDQICENYYQNTTIRNSNGTYTVRLPFKNSEVNYGNSRQKAAARLIQLERRFTKDENLRKKYQEFLNEYLEMGHMRKITRANYHQGKYYIPHQPVIKEDSLTTKLRVVFDASSKSSTNMSLNDNMFIGPRLQQDLAVILLRWRKHKVVFMADIEKMYRFIKINEQDLTYQRILWRESPKHAIDEYELTTVTYGTASAPYLAVKTLQQLAFDEKCNYPRASQVTLQDFYVDDILSGDSNIESAKQLQKDLICMLQAGGFNLRKWSSNYAELLQTIPKNTNDVQMLKIPLDETRKSLGVLWSPVEDNFYFKITVNKNETPTKRFILSEIAKLFDPLGWLSPVIINMKLIVQELWTNGAEWDKPVDGRIKSRWIEIQEQLKAIENISIPRWCHFTVDSRVELHGYSDASEKAYGAVIYCRIQNNNSAYDVTLLQAKSKVAPKKRKTTLPKLELCAALLLAQLMEKVINGIQIPIVNSYCWTDSMITLGWIKGEAERWKTFVANRVSEIQRILPQAKWNHVKTSENPADVITRGIDPNKLQHLDLWWNGPEWLKTNDIPSTKTVPEICAEIKRSYHIIIKPQTQNRIWERFSSFRKMVRVLSYCYRFAYKQRNKEPLSCMETNEVTKKVLLLVQKEVFPEEYKNIKSGLPLKKGNKLSCLDPFIDTDGLLRVGGRLQNSNLAYDQKHPILLPYNHHVTLIIIHDAHLTTLHGSNRLTLAYIRQQYWILGGKRIVKSYVRKCVKCLRYKSSTASQKMGILPKARVTESYPFSHTGIDYAGPIQVRAMKGRGHKSYKGYISIFVCLATKAVHLELVGDLSTETFIAALRRFMARRGPVAHIYSDNGTNFVGAANFLYKEMLEITQSSNFQNAMTNIGTQWHFIPPSSPHFGGIWEAGVRSMKHHLRRVIGEQTLTYEEMSTFLHQTEACLNSRPLCAQSEDINDNVVLTPSHFLIGREALGIPDPMSNINTDLINRWKQIQRMKKDFWKSWSKDYLHQLQQRYKWKTNQENLTIGTVVIMKDENISPSKWPLAKIKEMHTGNDGLTRVVTLEKSSGSTQKRSIHTLIPLPIKTTEESSNEPVTNVVQTNTITTLRNHKVNQSRKTVKCSKLFLLLIIILQIFSVSATTYSLKSIQPGFYVEQIGTTSIDRGIFRIETNFKREQLEYDFAKMKTVTKQFNQLCINAGVLIEATNCKQLYHHLIEEQTKFERTKEYLSEVNHTRKKRGLLGQLLTSVFGVNDEVYHDIDSLSLNQRKLIDAARHQTKFMISTISKVNNTEEKIRQKLVGFQVKLNQVIGHLEDYNHWYSTVDHNQINIHILQTYQLANNYITEIRDYYTGLLEIYLTKATVYNVLSPKNVSDIISSANNKLPSNLKICQQEILEAKLSENSTHIQIYAYFPIQDVAKYTLMHITPVPMKNADNTFQSIEVQKAYIGLDYNNELYFDLNHEEFKSCLQKRNHFLCFPGAVKNMQLHENCIVDQIFKNQTQSKCIAKTFDISNGAIWKQLYMQNTWLFIVKDRITVSIICDGQREEIELRDVGVIRISDNCIIKTTNNILAAQRLVSVQFVATYSKQIDFSVNTRISTSNILNITKEEVIDSSKDFFQHLITKENAVQSDLDSTIWKKISNHTYLTSFFSSIIMFTIILLIVFYGAQMVKWFGTTIQQHTSCGRGSRSKQSTAENSKDLTQTNAKNSTTQRLPDQPRRQLQSVVTNGHIYSQPQRRPTLHSRKPEQDCIHKQSATVNETMELYQLESCS